jgi:hypothetical protein
MISSQINRDAMTIHLNRKNLLVFLFIGVIFLAGFFLFVRSKYESEDILQNANSYYGSYIMNKHKYVRYNLKNSVEMKEIEKDIYDLKDEWFFENCLKNNKLTKESDMTMENLKEYVEQFYLSKDENCK